MKKQVALMAVTTATAFSLTGAMTGIALADANQTDASSIQTSIVSVPFLNDPDLAKRAGAISIKETLSLYGETYFMLPTFDNKASALKNIKPQTSKVLALLNRTYDFGELTKENWRDYRDALYEMGDREDCPSWYGESSDEFRLLRRFFDIYENDIDNQEIMSQAAFVKKSQTKLASNGRDEAQQKLVNLLPDQEVLLSRLGENNENAIEPCIGIKEFNIADGVAYAKDHALSPNKNGYGYFQKGDCANFASQILAAGGMRQTTDYPNEYRGWWHKKVNGSHKHSRVWKIASLFANYMNVTYKTKNNTAFSYSLKKGDFIAGDWTSDGKWDHIGFVTKKSKTTNKGAYDYKVAQHTTNYHLWTSSADNNWELVGSEGGTYGLMRRV